MQTVEEAWDHAALVFCWADRLTRDALANGPRVAEEEAAVREFGKAGARAAVRDVAPSLRLTEYERLLARIDALGKEASDDD